MRFAKESSAQVQLRYVEIHGMQYLLFTISTLLVCIGLAVDLFSLALGIRRLRGDGPSGLPLVSVVPYGIAALVVLPVIHLSGAIRMFGWLLLAHFVLQFGILLILHLALKAIGR